MCLVILVLLCLFAGLEPLPAPAAADVSARALPCARADGTYLVERARIVLLSRRRRLAYPAQRISIQHHASRRLHRLTACTSQAALASLLPAPSATRSAMSHFPLALTYRRPSRSIQSNAVRWRCVAWSSKAFHSHFASQRPKIKMWRKKKKETAHTRRVTDPHQYCYCMRDKLG